jgi:anti-sigma B factor antagonist
MRQNRHDPHFNWSLNGRIVVFQIKGTVLQTHNPELENKLNIIINENRNELLFDFTELNHICSSALGTLIQYKKKVMMNGGDLKIVVSDEDLSEVFEITGLDKVFELHYNLTDGLKSFQSNS